MHRRTSCLTSIAKMMIAWYSAIVVLYSPVQAQYRFAVQSRPDEFASVAPLDSATLSRGERTREAEPGPTDWPRLDGAVFDFEAEELAAMRELDLAYFREWLHDQYLEGPGISMRLGDFLQEARDEIASLEPEAQATLLDSLYGELINLRLSSTAPPAPPLGQLLSSLPPRQLFAAAYDGLSDRFNSHVGFGALQSAEAQDGMLADRPDFRAEPDDLQPSGGRNDWMSTTPGRYPGTVELPMVIPLEQKRYKLADAPYTIHAGQVPPNFVHTWAIDTLDLDTFTFNTKPNDFSLFWNQGDKITVVNACGKVLATFTSLSELATRSVTMPACAYDTGRPYKRIYVILETGPQPLYGRRFVLGALKNTTPNTGSEAAFVLADDINYGTTTDFVEAYNQFGKGVMLDPPWGANKAGKQYPASKTGDGWYLVGKNVSDPTKGYYTLLYYNEIEARLRLYLYNVSLYANVSAFKVEVALQGLVNTAWGKPQYADLKGAFFPVHANPKKWSKAVVTIPKWELGEWTFVEIPMLYPMGSNLPVATSNSKASKIHGKTIQWYHSLYEDPFTPDRKNVRLVVRVRGYQTGTWKGSFVGQAIGNAVQTFQSNSALSAFDVGKNVFESIKKGKDWYDDTGKFLDTVKKYLPKNSTDSDVQSLMQAGTSVFAGALGLAGAAISLFGAFFTDPEPLQLAIELALKGKLNGTMVSAFQDQTTYFYLPGRVSILDAFKAKKVPNTIDSVDRILPRYDRTLGLFGYQYPPHELEISVYRDQQFWKDPLDNQWKISEVNMRFPVKVEPPSPGWSQWSWDWGMLPTTFPPAAEKVIPRLPVIYNPYAEIAPVQTSPAPQYQLCDYAYQKHFACEADDVDCQSIVSLVDSCSRAYVKAFDDADKVIDNAQSSKPKLNRNDGLKLEVVNVTKPQTYRQFSDQKKFSVDRVYKVQYQRNGALPVNSPTWEPFVKVKTAPIHDMMYYWEVGYVYYGRSRKANGWVPKSIETTTLGAPITMFTVTSDDGCSFGIYACNSLIPIESALLQP